MLVTRRNQRGVSMIESLIALLVISVGLLGIAALQLTSVGLNGSALNHSQAVWIANNMADRIRANGGQFAAYNGKNTAEAPDNPGCMEARCSATDIVDLDTAEWAEMISILPSGQGLVTGDASNLEIRVMWDDEGTGASGTDCGTDPGTDLTCYIVAVSQ